MLGRKIRSNLATVSGVGVNKISTLERFIKESVVGVFELKGTTRNPNPGFPEPVIEQVGQRTLLNAVGLTNPGKDETAAQLADLNRRVHLGGVFLIGQAAGNNIEDVVETAATLEPHVHAIGPNYGCPHFEGGGSLIGSNIELACEYTRELRKRIKKPIIPKLTPMVADIGAMGKALLKAGADGFSLINTLVGDGNVITNRQGGLSGEAVYRLGLACVRKLRRAVGPDAHVIGMGGIGNVEQAREYLKRGADVVGVGTLAFLHRSTADTLNFYEALCDDLINGTNNSAGGFGFRDDWEYERTKIEKIDELSSDLKIFYFNTNIEAMPGQFVMAHIPGHHEKPFSIASADPLTLLIKKVGDFTSRTFNLKEGDKVWLRGPYGNGFDYDDLDAEERTTYLVAGGCGVAPIYALAQEADGGKNKIFVGARTANELVFIDKLREFGELVIATDDGSAGIKGTVLDALSHSLKEDPESGMDAYVCGPKAMMKRIPETLAGANPHKIEMAIETYMRCGIGVCDSCSIEGDKTCVDGPVFEVERLKGIGYFR